MAREVIEPGSDREERIAASVLYGLVAGLLRFGAAEIRSQFSFAGLTLEDNPAAEPNVPFTGLVIRMASGNYRVTIAREP